MCSKIKPSLVTKIAKTQSEEQWQVQLLQAKEVVSYLSLKSAHVKRQVADTITPLIVTPLD